jgi:hypothetical protein
MAGRQQQHQHPTPGLLKSTPLCREAGQRSSAHGARKERSGAAVNPSHTARSSIPAKFTNRLNRQKTRPASPGCPNYCIDKINRPHHPAQEQCRSPRPPIEPIIYGHTPRHQAWHLGGRRLLVNNRLPINQLPILSLSYYCVQR